MKKIRILTLLGMLTASYYSNAGVIYQINEVNTDVIFSYSGSIDLASTLGKEGDRYCSWCTRYNSSSSHFRIAGSNETSADDYNLAFTSTPTLGAIGISAALGGILSGDGFFFEQSSDLSRRTNQVWLQDNYVSGSSISGSMTYLNTDFTQMGLNIGSYNWTWANSGVSDFVTINVNDAASVPEPASLALLGLGLAGIGFSRKKKSV